MTENISTERLAYLAEKFEVFENDPESVNAKITSLLEAGYKPRILLRKPIGNNASETELYTMSSDDPAFKKQVEKDNILAILYIKVNDLKKSKRKAIFTQNELNKLGSMGSQIEVGNKEIFGEILMSVCVSMNVFSDIVAADPTPNKFCVQWMLLVFTRYLKEGGDKNIVQAMRFVVEDLPVARNYIELFEANKRKVKFKRLCTSSFVIKGVKDPTDINQYKSLSQLYDAVDPFIERDPSEMEKLLLRYVAAGEALIPVKDRKFTLYIPLTLDASVIFDSFASWCTAKKANSNFASYTSNKRPDGQPSKLYIILDNKFFTQESNDLWQLHFESKQLKNQKNDSVEMYERVFSQSEGLSNFFHDELMVMALKCGKGFEDNRYLDYLVQFGFPESLFEIIPAESPSIRFMKKTIPKMPDMTRFKKLDTLIITNAQLTELHPSIGKLKDLQMLMVPENSLTTLPKEIGQLKELMFINVIGNPIKEIPDEIKYLDPENGGKLFRIAVNEEDIGIDNLNKLKRLLPTAIF